MYMPMYNPSVVRKQLYITDSQERALKERARRYRVTEAELVRRGIDQSLDASGAMRADPEAWAEVVRFIRRRMKTPARRSARRWTRGEIYDRR
jgi:hypothetical protein